MYQDLYDSKHKVYLFNPHDLAQGKERVSRPSSGDYEGGLLCAECDNKILGSLEDYASKAIYGGRLAKNVNPVCDNYINQEGIKYTVCRNIDYKKFKLFLLSILWRASICTRPMFDQVNLGPHTEPIRKMIYESDPKSVTDYPIFFMTYVNDKQMPKDLIAHPQTRRTKDGLLVYVFIIGGIIYNFYVNSTRHIPPDHVLEATIKPGNEMYLYHIPPGRGWDLLLGFYGLKNRI